jgi:hypothetical protein
MRAGMPYWSSISQVISQAPRLPPPQHLAAMLKQARKEKGLVQMELAHQIGTT